MSVDVAEIQTPDEAEYGQYRALSSAAVATMVVGCLSLLAFLNPWFAVIPVAGVLLGIVAIKKVRRQPDEFTGEGIAKAGLMMSLIFGIAGPSYLGYVYATEVPDGSERISYSQLQPEIDQPGQVVPPSALALNGKKVFIKGFVYPTRENENIKQFILCRDQGDCCFGGKPKITDRIDVVLTDPLRLSFSPRMFKLAGTFRIEPTQAPDGTFAFIYHLDADYLQ